jgi:hypothetical protein
MGKRDQGGIDRGSMLEVAKAGLADAAAGAAGGTVQRRNPVIADPQPGQGPGRAGGAGADPEPGKGAGAAGSEAADGPKSLQDRLAEIGRSVKEVPVRFRHKDVSVSFDKFYEYAQKGMAADALDQRRADIDRVAKENDAAIRAGQMWEDWIRRNPEQAEMVRDIVEGRRPTRPLYDQQQDPDPLAPDPDYGGLTDLDSHPKMRAYERRIAELEARVSQTAKTFEERDRASSIEAAIGEQAYLKDNLEAREVAGDMIPTLMHKEGLGPREAAAIVASQLQRLAQFELARVQRQREQQRSELASVPAGAGTPHLPAVDLEALDPGVYGMRRGNVRGQLKSWISNAMRQASSGPS